VVSNRPLKDGNAPIRANERLQERLRWNALGRFSPEPKANASRIPHSNRPRSVSPLSNRPRSVGEAACGADAVGREASRIRTPSFSGRFERGPFSGSALVRHTGHEILDRGYGDADRETRRPSSPEMVLRVASVRTEFAAAAVLRPQEANRIPVQDSVPPRMDEAPESWAPIPVPPLPAHSSGHGRWRRTTDPSHESI
jgi:CubicO group peptidase (beta-lactamase class C family)